MTLPLFIGNYRKFFPAFLGIFLCLFLLIIQSFWSLGWLRSDLEKVVSYHLPMERTFGYIIHAPEQVIKNFLISQAELQQLRDKHQQALTRVAELEWIEQDHQRLQAELEQFTEYQLIEPQRINHANMILSHQQAGIMFEASSGIESDDWVFAQGALIGKVGERGQNFAKVATFQTESLSLVVQTAEGVKGVLASTNGQLVVEQLPADAEIKSDDFIYTAGSIDQKLPKGLLVGQITSVEKSAQAGVQRATLSQPINLSAVISVMVLGY